MDKNTAIKTNNINKYFNGFRALSDVSLHVARGEVFGFIGRNGAGKTTFMRIICSLIKPSSGTYEAGKNLSFLPQNVRIRDNMSADEVLRFFAGLRGCGAEEGQNFAGELEIDLKKRAASLSPGQQRKLQLAVAAIGAPEILVLDEPTAGLDPSAVQQVRSIVKKLNQRGSTVFISSHILLELENLCGTIAIIDKGELLYQGKSSNIYEIEAEGMDKNTAALLSQKIIGSFKYEGKVLTAGIRREEVPRVLSLLYERGVKVFGVKRRGIETLFNSIVKERGIN